MELGQVWHLSQSQAYAILKRLENRGDISAQLIEQEKLPARQVFHITAAGRRRFFKWLNGGIGTTARSIRLEFLTRLYFTQFMSLKTFQGFIARNYRKPGRRLRGWRDSLKSYLPVRSSTN